MLGKEDKGQDAGVGGGNVISESPESFRGEGTLKPRSASQGQILGKVLLQRGQLMQRSWGRTLPREPEGQ